MAGGDRGLVDVGVGAGGGSAQPFADENHALHEAIVAVSANSILKEMHARLLVRVRRPRYMALLSQERWDESVREHAEVLAAFEAKDAQTITDFSEATVVFLYLGDFLNEALRPTLQKTLKPGTRVVSHRFLMGDWKPDRTEVINAKDNDGEVAEFKLHLWTIK